MGSNKATARSKSFLSPVGESSNLMAAMAALTSGSATSIFSMRYPTRERWLGISICTFSAQRWRETYAARCWERYRSSVVEVPPVNLRLMRKSMLVLASLSHIAGPACCSFKARNAPLPSRARLKGAIEGANFVPLVAVSTSSKTVALSSRNSGWL